MAIPTVEQVRGKGLWVGIVLKPEAGTARAACERLMARGRAREGHARDDDPTWRLRSASPRMSCGWALDRIVPVLQGAGA